MTAKLEWVFDQNSHNDGQHRSVKENAVDKEGNQHFWAKNYDAKLQLKRILFPPQDNFRGIETTPLMP